MKKRIAAIANTLLVAIGAFFVFTNSFIVHRPETPEEFLN
jgi:cyclic lactone autoinducer peptide